MLFMATFNEDYLYMKYNLILDYFVFLSQCFVSHLFTNMSVAGMNSFQKIYQFDLVFDTSSDSIALQL